MIKSKIYSLLAVLIMMIVIPFEITNALPVNENGDRPASSDKTFQSEFTSTPDRIWPGGAYWTNPMEDWQINDGRLESLKPGANRNIQLLTHGGA